MARVIDKKWTLIILKCVFKTTTVQEGEMIEGVVNACKFTLGCNLMKECLATVASDVFPFFFLVFSVCYQKQDKLCTAEPSVCGFT